MGTAAKPKNCPFKAPSHTSFFAVKGRKEYPESFRGAGGILLLQISIFFLFFFIENGRVTMMPVRLLSMRTSSLFSFTLLHFIASFFPPPRKELNTLIFQLHFFHEPVNTSGPKFVLKTPNFPSYVQYISSACTESTLKF